MRKKQTKPVAVETSIAVAPPESASADADLDTFIPDAEVAAMLKVTPAATAAWRCKGTGPHFYKVGRRVFYTKRDIQTWLATRRRKVATQEAHA